MPETPTNPEQQFTPPPPRMAGLGWPDVSRETFTQPGTVAGLGWPA